MSRAKKSEKKEFRTRIAEQLITTFGDFKKTISAKKFERKIRKASKILSQGVTPSKNGMPGKKERVKKSDKHAKEPKLANTQ